MINKYKAELEKNNEIRGAETMKNSERSYYEEREKCKRQS